MNKGNKVRHKGSGIEGVITKSENWYSFVLWDNGLKSYVHNSELELVK